MDTSRTICGPHILLFILFAVLQINATAAVNNHCSPNKACCVSENPIHVKENNNANLVISNITIREPPVTILDPSKTPDVAVNGTTLVLTKTIDFENLTSPVILFTLHCGMLAEQLPLIIEIHNENDNIPKFPEKVLNYSINELFPVNKTWKTVAANDPDNDQIFYHLDPNTDGAKYFKLKTQNTPEIILKKPIDYEKTKILQLILSAMESPNGNVTDTVSINISVLDQDNKPPEFEPCIEIVGPTASICRNAIYTGNIKLGVTETSPLQLKPQQIQAVDGDKGINTLIQYRMVHDYGKTFKINQNTGEITMSKPVKSLNPVALTVVAYQENDHYKYSMTTVTLNVLEVNKCPPQFTKTIYYGNMQENSEPGSIVFEQGSTSKPVIIKAEDCDFPDKINPSIKYKITPSNNFIINRDGFIFTKTKLVASNLYDLLVTAIDDEHGQNATTKLKVQVTSSDATTTVKTTTSNGNGTPKPPSKPPGTKPTSTGPSTPTKVPPRPPQGSTTAKPPGPGPTTTKPHVSGSITTNNPEPPGSITPSRKPPDGSGTTTTTTVKTTTSNGNGTPKPPSKPPGTKPTSTGPSTPTKVPPRPPQGSTTAKPPGPGPTTTKPHVSGSITTNNPEPPGSITPSRKPPDGSGTTSLPAVNPKLMYEAKHMAALGVPLAILLIICFIIIGILLRKLHVRKMEWERLQDRSLTKFSRGSLQSNSDKLQFTNEGYLEKAKSEGTEKLSWPRWKNPPILESSGLAAILEPPKENSNPTESSDIQSATISQSTNAVSTIQENDKAHRSSEETENDTEVKSILTKERRSDEGYKSVWFKEDIQPEANEEHVIEWHDDEEVVEEGYSDLDSINKDDCMIQLKSYDKHSITL
ncbi:cadherin-related family member 5 isoform X2 [Stegostoma tigrinum]|uniref:cadherin-related family member 5 isoform X2 n=1 Tax=Stegostoma tigrinum TaxID=3053191 RepID=UPI0028702C31|nr:cadherin-related family member 5 isoform X2 [Stegostoma tigrinum]